MPILMIKMNRVTVTVKRRHQIQCRASLQVFFPLYCLKHPSPFTCCTRPSLVGIVLSSCWNRRNSQFQSAIDRRLFACFFRVNIKAPVSPKCFRRHKLKVSAVDVIETEIGIADRVFSYGPIQLAKPNWMWSGKTEGKLNSIRNKRKVSL